MIIQFIFVLKTFVILMAFCIFYNFLTRTKGKPTRWPVLGELVAMAMNINKVHDWITDVLEVTGGTVKISGLGMKERVITSHPQNIRHILKDNFDNYVKGEQLREAMKDFLGDGVILIDGKRLHSVIHIIARAFCSSSFRLHTVLTVENLVNQRLLPELKRVADASVSVDLQSITLPFSFVSISMVCIGVDPEFLTQAANTEDFLRAFQKGIELSTVRYMMPPLLWNFVRFVPFGPAWQFNKAKSVVWSWVRHAILFRSMLPQHTDEELQKGRAMDVLSAMLLLAPDSAELPQEGDLALNMLLAGKDTVNACLLWMFWSLHLHPHVEQNVLTEMRRIIRSRHSNKPKGAPFSVEEIRNMEYLQAVVSETLRLYPPSPFDVTEAENDDMLPDGTVVKRGSSVVYSIYSVGKSKELWGDDAKEFKPERWLVGDDGKYEGKSEFKFLAFNAGPRRCQGREVANLLVKWTAASVIRNYIIQVIPGQEIATKLSMSLPMKNGLRAYVKARPNIMENQMEV